MVVVQPRDDPRQRPAEVYTSLGVKDVIERQVSRLGQRGASRQDEQDTDARGDGPLDAMTTHGEDGTIIQSLSESIGPTLGSHFQERYLERGRACFFVES